jgi:ATP-binding cassette subfamily B protein
MHCEGSNQPAASNGQHLAETNTRAAAGDPIPQGLAFDQAGKESAGKRSYLRRVLALLSRRKQTLAGIMLASLILNLFGLVTPRMTQFVLDEAVPARDLALLGRIVLVLGLVTAYQIVLTIYRRLALVRLTLILARAMLKEFCAHLLSLPAQFFKVHASGDLVARFSDEGYARHPFTSSLTRVAIDSVMVVIYFVVMFFYSATLTLLVMAFLLVFAGYTAATGPILKRSHKRVLEERAAQESLLREFITSIDLVKSMALEQAVQRRWHGYFCRYLETDYRTKKLRQILESMSTAITFISMIGVLWCGAVLVIQGYLTTGELVAFSMYASQVMLPLLSLVALLDEVQLARAALERVGEVLAQKPEMQRAGDCQAVPQRAGGIAVRPGATPQPFILQGRVTFDNVYFQYEGQPAPLLRGISFEIKPGEHVAIVGRNYSGKTTLARLILGLYRPTHGRVLIDGRDLCELDLAVYRRQVGVVLQENLLLAGTVEENIALGDDWPNRERVVRAASLAGADEFIAQLRNGYNTVVGDLGLTLSGGQRQRINLARALYRDPQLLILDEPTSALDSESERSIQKSLQAAMHGRTALIITHSSQVLHDVHRILVLENGQAVTDPRSR